MTVDHRRIGPVRPHHDHREPLPLDQPARDSGAAAIEFGSVVARLAKQHDPGVVEPVDRRGKGWIVDFGLGSAASRTSADKSYAASVYIRQERTFVGIAAAYATRCGFGPGLENSIS